MAAASTPAQAKPASTGGRNRMAASTKIFSASLLDR